MCSEDRIFKPGATTNLSVRVGSVVLAMFAGVAVSAEVYSVKNLGPLGNLRAQEPLSRPSAINASGMVAAGNVTNGAYRALVYGSSWANLGTLGGNESMGFGINNTSQVVGRSSNLSGAMRAFLWTAGGKDGSPGNPQMKDLGTLGGTASEATAINNFGQVTGYADTASDQHAFLYSGGMMVDIGKLLDKNLPNSFGYAINNAGRVVGAAYDERYTKPRAFFFNGSSMVMLGQLSGVGSTAMAINDSDRIVGYWITSEWFDRAFTYAAGQMTDLGTLGGNYSYALGINNSNRIVGASFVDSRDTIYHAFISEGSSLADLNTQLDSSGAGWTLQEARAINDAGQIVGTGLYNGKAHAFLLQPSAGSGLVAPQINGVSPSGMDVLVSFSTVDKASYTLLRRGNAGSGAWTPVATGISGNGGTVTVKDTGALASPQRFYRAVLNP